MSTINLQNFVFHSQISSLAFQEAVPVGSLLIPSQSVTTVNITNGPSIIVEASATNLLTIGFLSLSGLNDNNIYILKGSLINWYNSSGDLVFVSSTAEFSFVFNYIYTSPTTMQLIIILENLSSSTSITTPAITVNYQFFNFPSPYNTL